MNHQENRLIAPSERRWRTDDADRGFAISERERFHALGADLLAVDGLNGHFNEVSPECERMLGWTAAELTAQPWENFLHPDDLQATRYLNQQLIQGKEVPSFENRYRHKDGTYRWLHWKFKLDAGDGVIYAAATDVTDRKRAESLRAGQRQVLEMIATGKPLPDVLTELCRVIEQQESGLLCSILLTDEQGRHTGMGYGPSLSGVFVQALQGIKIDSPHVGSCCKALDLGEEVLVEDIENDSRWSPHWRELNLSHGLRACRSIPILGADGKVLASVAVFRRQAGDPGPSNKELLNVATHLAGIAIERKQSEDRERRLLIEAATANAQFRAFFEQGALFAGIMNTDGTIIEPNRLCLESCGYTREQVLGKLFWECPWWSPSPALVQRIKEASAQAAAGATFRAELPYYLADGSERIVDFILLPIKDDAGQVMFLAPTGTDITDRKRAEAAQRHSELRYRLVGQAANDAIWDWDLVTDQATWHEGVQRLFGYTSEQIGPDASWWCETIHPDDRQRVVRGIHAAIDGGAELWRAEYRFRRADGSYAEVLDRGQIVREAGKPVRMVGSMLDLTERKRAEEALRHSETQYRLIVEGNPALICRFRPDGTLTYVNDTYCRTFGQTREELVGRRFMPLIPIEDQPTVARILSKLAPDMTPHTDEHRVIVADGAIRWHRWTNIPIVDAQGHFYEYQAIGIDITDRKEAEQRLAEAHQFLHSSIDALSSHIAVLDENGVILAVNDAWRQFADANDYVGSNYGVGSNYIAACEPMTSDQNDDRSAARGLSDVLAGRKEIFELEYSCHTPTQERWFVTRMTRFKSPGPVRVVVAHEDVTERRKAEQALREADRRKDEFLATLAHELRNPLAPIRNGLQIMRLADADHEAVEQARTMMERQLAQMVHLVDDLLDLSRISRGKIELRKERVELAKVVQQAVETSRPAIEQSGHDLTVDVPPGVIYVDADMTRLAQVFSNLLHNAAKYTERGGRIRLTVLRHRNDVVVSVRDSGIGIPSHMLPHVFDMFTQVDRNLERSQGGLGIGLSIVKRLVEMHGGSVVAKSDGHGMGSEFVVHLPVDVSVVESPFVDGAVVQSLSRRRILVVDDNRDAAVSLAMMLNLMGNDARTAHDGLEALDVAAAFRPDLVLLDIGMPRLNGYDTAKQIRQQPWGKSMALVALTGWGQEEDRRKSEQAGFNSHMVKPIEPAALDKLLANLEAGMA